MKYKVKMKISWMNEEFEGTLNEIYDQINKFQDLECLISQIYSYETEDDTNVVVQIEEFVYKHRTNQLTMDDYKNLNVDLRIGTISCISIEKNE